MNLKRESGLVVATTVIVSGLFMINSPDFEEKTSDIKITKIDKNTEIRVVEGNKYLCTLLHEK